MKTVTLQTRNVDIKVKEKVEKIALKWGYSGVQSVIRKLLEDIAAGRITLNTTWGAGLDNDVQESIQEYRTGKSSRIDSLTDLDRLFESD